MCARGWLLYASPFVSIYCIFTYLGLLLLQGALQESVYLELGGLPKQCTVSLTARPPQADRVRTSINQAYKGHSSANGSVSVNDVNVIC